MASGGDDGLGNLDIGGNSKRRDVTRNTWEMDKYRNIDICVKATGIGVLHSCSCCAGSKSVAGIIARRLQPDVQVVSVDALSDNLSATTIRSLNNGDVCFVSRSAGLV